MTVVLLVLVIGIFFYGSPLTRNQLKQDVVSYLQENGYESITADQVKTMYRRSGEPSYLAQIKTEDVTAWFGYDAAGEIQEVDGKQALSEKTEATQTNSDDSESSETEETQS